MFMKLYLYSNLYIYVVCKECLCVFVLYLWKREKGMHFKPSLLRRGYCFTCASKTKSGLYIEFVWFSILCFIGLNQCSRLYPEMVSWPGSF